MRIRHIAAQLVLDEPRQPRVLIVSQRIEGLGPEPLRLRNRIQMDGEEQIGIRLPHQGSARLQVLRLAPAVSSRAPRCQIGVRLPRQDDFRPRLLQVVPQVHGNLQRHFLLLKPRRAPRSAVRSAVAGIKHDDLAGQRQRPVCPRLGGGKLIGEHDDDQHNQQHHGSQTSAGLAGEPHDDSSPLPHHKNPPRPDTKFMYPSIWDKVDDYDGNIDYFADSAVSASPSIRIFATSGRVNSGGGHSPARSKARTFVPERCR